LYHLKERKKKPDGKGKQMGEVTHNGDLETGSFFQLLSGPLKASYSIPSVDQCWIVPNFFMGQFAALFLDRP
jgi:hypothetical protein